MRFIALTLILLVSAAAHAASTDPVASGAQSDFELVLRDPNHPDAIDPVAQGEYRRYRLSDLVDSIFAGPGGGGGGVTDHGNLSGLGDDDHPQYFNSIRGDARYSLTGHGHSSLPTSNQKAAMDGANSPSVLNPFATMNDIGTGGGGGVTDHGALTGLADDDHPQYFNQARGDLRYSLLGHGHAGTYEPANANIQSHIGSTGNAHGMTAVQVINLIRGYFPEWCPPVKQTGQPSLDAELTARLAEIGCLPEDVLWVEGTEPGAPPGETDTTGPTGSISIAGGAQYTTSGTVNLTLSASDPSGVDQMQFSNDGSSYSTAEAYATSKSWSLTAGDGTKTVYAKFKDALGNWSGAYSDTILRDGTAPTSSASPTGGTYASTQNVTLSGSDATSGLAAIHYTTDGSTPTTGSATYSSPIEIASTTTLKFFARDNAGNNQAVQTQSYTINAVTDTTAPTVDTFTVGSPTDMTVPITAFTASDDVGVTSYLVTESSSQPSAASVNLSPAPTSYTTASYGTKSLYPWARDAAGNVSAAFGSPRSVNFVQAIPGVPSGLTATGGTGQIAVSWDSMAGADTYDLQVSYTETGTYSDLSMAQAATGYTHDGLGDEETKWYKVRATNEAGSSAYSAAVSGTTDAASTFPVTDDFNRSDGGLGSNWATVTGNSAPQIVSNQLYKNESIGKHVARRVDVSFPANQWASCQAATTGSTQTGRGAGVILRASPSANTFYSMRLEVFDADYLTIAKTVNGVYTEIDYTAPQPDSWIRGRVSGNTLYLDTSSDGVTWTNRITTTDSSIGSGSPGVILNMDANISSGHSTSVDNWAAGAL